MNGPLVLCLCIVCRNQFATANGAYLRRVNHKQEVKEVCTYCQVRMGYDYYVPGCHGNEGRRAGGVPEH